MQCFYGEQLVDLLVRALEQKATPCPDPFKPSYIDHQATTGDARVGQGNAEQESLYKTCTRFIV